MGQPTEHGLSRLQIEAQRSGKFQSDGRFTGLFEKPHPAVAFPVRTDLKDFAIFVVDRHLSGPLRHASSRSSLSERSTRVTDIG